MTGTVIALPSELFALAQSSRFDGEFPTNSLTYGPDTYTFPNGLHWDVEVTNTGEAFLVMGTLRGDAVVPCARCLEDAEYPIDVPVDGYFVIEPSDDDDDEQDDIEFGVVSPDHTIDIMDALQSALVLELPMTPLCRDDCKGLCPHCGANLNDGDCGCEAVSIAADDSDDIAADNPFAVLKTLKLDD